MPDLSVKSKKSLTYSLFILLVLGIFMFGYFYYFVPRNIQAIHKNGFLILKTIAENVQSKNGGHSNLFRNIFNNAKGSAGVTGFLKKNNIDATFQYVAPQSTAANEQQASQEKNIAATNDSTITSFSINNNDFVYSIKKRRGNDSSLIFREAINDFLNSILVTQKNELFNFYALVKVKGGESQLLYHDTDFGMRSDIKIDSLLPKNVQAYLSGIRDITLQDAEHKMFFYPFQIDTVQVVLCGFVRSDNYNTFIRKVPFSFVYPLAILFVLLIVFLPIIKFAIMDSNEQVRIRDLIMFGSSVFVGASILTLIIIQYLLWKGEEERVKDNLQSLSNQIHDGFLQELNKEYDQLNLLDSLRLTDVSLKDSIATKKHINYSAALRNYIRSSNYSNSNYYLFDRVSWIDSTGMQIIKAETDGDKPVFTNVKDREYFKAFENNNPFFLSNKQGLPRPFGWEPIYSWTNGDFNVSISKQSEEYIEALAAKMYSVIGTLLPVGYGFCIIDDEGKVQLHSDVDRNLRENIFEKADPASDIVSSVAARQVTNINEVEMYGKLYIMNVRPVKDLPYSLVTFYDRGFIVPVNMRILIFSLLFCIFSWLTCLLLWIALGRLGFRNYPLVYCPMDCLSWLSPQKKEAEYYFHGIAFLIVYVTLFIGFIGLYNSYYISNYTIFSMVLLTPLNVIAALFAIRSRCTKKKNNSELLKWTRKSGDSIVDEAAGKLTVTVKQVVSDKVFHVALVQLAVSLILYFASLHKYNISKFFLLFQFVFFIWILLYKLVPQPQIIKRLKKKALVAKGPLAQYYMFGYSVLATLLIITLSVLPSSLYTWYAHNQEILQTVKKQQLHLATDLQERGISLYNQNDSLIIPSYYAKQLIFEKGIYTIHNEDIRFENDNVFDKTKKVFAKQKDSLSHNREVFENFYFTIADKVGTSYYDPQKYPALHDYTSDSSWRWYVQQQKVHFWYYNPIYIRNNPLALNESLHIISTMPDRFVFLKISRIGGLLLVIVLLVWGLYKWVRVNTEQVFLLKYLSVARDVVHKLRRLARASANNETANNETQAADVTNRDWISEYFASKNIKRESVLKYYYTHENYGPYTAATNPRELNKFEKEVLGHIEGGKDLYEFIWNKCSEKEKYLLYDYANDGLINYKNTPEIYNLIDKGVFTLDEGDKIRLFSPAFRAYLISKAETAEIIQLHKMHKENSNWQSLRMPLLILLVGIASLIFFTQQETFQKLVGLAVGVGTLFSQIPKLLGIVGSKTEAKDK